MGRSLAPPPGEGQIISGAGSSSRTKTENTIHRPPGARRRRRISSRSTACGPITGPSYRNRARTTRVSTVESAPATHPGAESVMAREAFRYTTVRNEATRDRRNRESADASSARAQRESALRWVDIPARARESIMPTRARRSGSIVRTRPPTSEFEVTMHEERAASSLGSRRTRASKYSLVVFRTSRTSGASPEQPAARRGGRGGVGGAVGPGVGRAAPAGPRRYGAAPRGGPPPLFVWARRNLPDARRSRAWG